MTELISPTQFKAMDGVEEWRILGDGITAFYPTRSFGDATRFAAAIGSIEGVERHPPDLDVRPDGVTVRLLTKRDDWYGPSTDDVEIARKVTGVAGELGLSADPARIQSLLVVPGAPKGIDVMPFWEAVLGYDRRPDSPDEDLVDPRNRWPAFWFEEMRDPRGDGGGAIHVAVWVPIERAEERVQAALSAGGRLVRDTWAPAWWTLADGAGNEVDISTVENRD